jgi:hypothetical protein
VLRAELACGRVGDDVDGMAVQPDRPALRLLSGPAACMTASWHICMARGIVPPRVSVVVLAPRVMAHVPVGAGESSCEAETALARRRLVVRGGDLSGGIPLVGNWSEMLQTGRRLGVLSVLVLTGVLSPPRLESWP